MPAPQLSRWQGLEVELHPDGSLPHVRLEGHDEDLLTDVRVALTGAWECQGTELLVDELEQRHEWRRDGQVAARCVTRIVLDDTWSIRLQITNLTDEPLVVDPARLEMTSHWPLRRHLAGAEGQISLDAGREDAALLTFTQLRGRSRLSEGHSWLTDLPVRLGPAGSAAATYQVSWRVDWLRDERMQAAALPGWWPESTVLAEGDVVELRLPDAAVEAAGINILLDEDLTILTGRPGRHLAQVHTGRGTTDVELHWADDLAPAHLLPAVHRILDEDPRTLWPHQVFLLGRAVAAGGLGQEAVELLEQAVENLAARPGPCAPLGVAAVADECLRTGAPDLVEALEEMVARMPDQAGATLVALHAALALRLQAGTVRVPTPAAHQPLSEPRAEAVEQAMMATERACLAHQEQMPAEALRTAALLGAGLPGRVLEHLDAARLCAILSLAPEGWETLRRWPVALGEAREQARRRLLAEHCDEQALAWLLW